MVFVQPEQRVTDQEIAHFIPAVVEDVTMPFRMVPLPRVHVFIEVRPVKIHESMDVVRKMGWDPVEDHTDPLLVQAVDEMHEVLWRSVTACGSKIAGNLVS